MLRIRMVEEKIASQYPKQEMRCPVHLCIGQEAVAAGIGLNLHKNDVVFSTHRSHGHYLAKGGSLKRMIAEIYGKEDGCTMGRGGSQHLVDLSVNFIGATPIVAGTIPLAVGAAMAIQMQNKNNIAVSFFGDGACEEGVFHESLNFAALKRFPVLFVCENNYYSTLTPISLRQPKREIFLLAKSYGIVSLQEDGNDVEKIYLLAKKALRLIKSGKGPVFLEFLTYRHLEHCGPSMEPVGYRPKKELDNWLSKCPVKTYERKLLNQKIMTLEEINTVRIKVEKEIKKAFTYANDSPYPEEDYSKSTQNLIYA